MTLDPWLHLGHILGAIAWVGGGFVLVVLGLRARRSGDPGRIGEFGRTLAYVGPRVLAPGVAAVIVFGLWLILANEAWDFGQLWIQLALGLFAVAFIVGVLYLSRIGIALGRIADHTPASDGRALVDRWLRGYAFVLAILLVAIWDMVFKPGL